MHVLRTLLVVASTVLAGCTGNAGTDDTPAVGGGDEAFKQLKPTEDTGIIRGVVVDQSITPVAEVTVSLTVPGEAARDTRTLADGSFGFDRLPAGTYFLRASKAGYNSTQVSTDVVAGVEPPVLNILLEENPSEQPFFQDYSYEGFITCGAAIGLTSVGCTTFPDVANQLGDKYIWNVKPDALPTWAQGELVWDQTQAAGGMLIWEMVRGGTNTFQGYRETGESPALAYWNTTVIEENEEVVLNDGIDYRVFGGPHPLLRPGGTLPPRESCPTVVFNPCSFGFGLTLNQDFTSYMHMFYNWAPDEGWRFTVDGAPVPPQ